MSEVNGEKPFGGNTIDEVRFFSPRKNRLNVGGVLQFQAGRTDSHPVLGQSNITPQNYARQTGNLRQLVCT